MPEKWRVDSEPVAIFRDSSRYTTFPDVKRLPDGRLLCVFRDASFPEQIKHIESDARIVGCTSADSGRSWSAPFLIYDDLHCQNDPSVVVLRNGGLLLSFFSWEGLSEEYVKTYKPPFARRVDRGEWGTYAQPGGVFLIEGLAGSLTFSPHARVIIGDERRLYATSSSVLETRDGSLLMPVYGRVPERMTDQAFVCISTNGGQTWLGPTCIASDPENKVAMQEPALVETADGAIVAILRTTHAEDHLYTTRSTDHGRSWTPAVQTELIGHPADLQLLPDGRLLIVYGYRHEPFGVRACISEDAGLMWRRSNEFVITDRGAHTDLGYPSVCLTDDDHACVVYYMNGPNTKDRWIECQRIPLSVLADAQL